MYYIFEGNLPFASDLVGRHGVGSLQGPDTYHYWHGTLECLSWLLRSFVGLGGLSVPGAGFFVLEQYHIYFGYFSFIVCAPRWHP
jgi:hypothetical protein